MVDGEMWKVIECCWSIKPEERPTCQQILQELGHKEPVGEHIDQMSERVAGKSEHFRSIMGRNSDVTIDLTKVRHILDEVCCLLAFDFVPGDLHFEDPY